MWNSGKKIVASLILAGTFTCALASTAPPGGMSTFTLVWDTTRHVFDYTHFKVLGACVWLVESKEGIPYLAFTLELDEYLPDFVVTSFNEAGDDPWYLARTTLDTASFAAGDAAARSLTGYPLGNGKTVDSNNGRQKANSLITKSVDVIGYPDALQHFPFLRLRSDTHAFFPYYSSTVDIPGRLGLAEAPFIRPEDADLLHYFIGQRVTNRWGYEFPRSMTSNTFNDYTASVMAALRAVDIVTNKHALHIVRGTHNTCGTQCAVAAVVEERGEQQAIWQEVYPRDRHIRIGEDLRSTPVGHTLGEQDEKAGNGNYVFVVWRHYRGCIQHAGKFLWAMQDVPPTKKR